MKIIEFIVPGIPRPQGRPRAGRRGKHASVYKDEKSRTSEQTFLSLCIQHRPDVPFTGAVNLKLKFVFPRPKNHFGTGRNNAVLKESAKWISHTKTPDLDNLVKLVADSFNGIFWEDDKQIDNLTAEKRYGNPPRTVVLIMAETKDV